MRVMVNLEVLQQALAEQMVRYLDDAQPALRADMLEALSEGGKILHQPIAPLDGRWALVPLLLASDLRADADPVVARGAALALECVICATDLFDDVMDEDVTPLNERLGMARVLNTALALLALAQRILATTGRDAATQLRLLASLQHTLLLATAGQQQDLLAEQRPACDLSREECVAIAAAKAGSLLSLACQFGALCAGVDEACLASCAEMGRLLGIAAQLDNDAHDLFALLRPEGGQKSDLRRGKKTLPVVLAAHVLREERVLTRDEIDAAFQHVVLLAPAERTRAALREGILVTWGISLLYRERARKCLQEMMGERPISPDLLQALGLDTAMAESENW